MAKDKISLRGMTFYGFHGVSPEERAMGQQFVVDIELEVSLAKAGKSDSIADTTNYSHAFKLVQEVVQGPGRNLLESLAEAIASRLLATLDVEAVMVRVTKPHVPIHGVLSSASVEIYRRKGKKP